MVHMRGQLATTVAAVGANIFRGGLGGLVVRLGVFLTPPFRLGESNQVGDR